MPEYGVSADGSVSQRDPWGRGLTWPQQVDVIPCDGARLLNVSGKAYGFFAQDSLALEVTMARLSSFEKPLERISLLANLWENYLDGRLDARRLAAFLADWIPGEKEPLLVSAALGYLGALARYGDLALSPEIEALLVRLARNQALGAEQSTAFRTLTGVCNTPAVIEAVYRIWNDQAPWPGVKINDTQYVTLALELAIRLPERSAEILRTQRSRIQDPDRLREFDFICPAVSPERSVRDSVFFSLLVPENRRVEPWAESALAYLNHPLRQAEALDYILPGLEAVQEVPRTGDIFFPRKWVAALLRGHDSPEADAVVDAFLASRPDYPTLLKNKILQVAAHGRRKTVSP